MKQLIRHCDPFIVHSVANKRGLLELDNLFEFSATLIDLWVTSGPSFRRKIFFNAHDLWLELNPPQFAVVFSSTNRSLGSTCHTD